MSSLSSQSSNLVLPKPILPLLTGPADYPIYLKELRIHLRTNFGAIGQHIINNTPVDLDNPGQAPHYDDPRINPRTLLPIQGSRMYTQVAMTEVQAADQNFDASDLDLTQAAKDLLKENMASYEDRRKTCKKELLKYRAIDDSLLNLLYSTQTAAVKEILSSNVLTIPFNKLSSTAINRSAEYLDIMANQFSKGNSNGNIIEITRFLNLTQDHEETEAAWTNRAFEHFARIEPILSPAQSVEALLQMLLCMVIMKGTNRRKHSNLRAIEIHIMQYPDFLDSLLHLEELRTGILAGVYSDLNHADEPISTQSSAFKATIDTPTALAAVTLPPSGPKQPRPPKDPLKGVQKDGRTDHCTYCLTNFSKYFYHKVQDCTLKKRKITASSSNSANLATTPPPSADQVKAYLASLGLEIVDGPLPTGDDDA